MTFISKAARLPVTAPDVPPVLAAPSLRRKNT